MISIAICDDNTIIVEEIKQIIQNYIEEKSLRYQIDCCYSAQELRRLVDECRYDLIFLDIELKDGDGFQLAGELRKMGIESELAFVSSHEERVFESYLYEPIWFIRKDDLCKTLRKVLNRYLKKLEENTKYYRFGTGVRAVTLRLSNILYMECNGHTISIYSWKQEPAVIYGSLKPLEKELEKEGFVRIHKNYMINLNKVYSIGSKEVELINHDRLPLSKERKEWIKQLFLERG